MAEDDQNLEAVEAEAVEPELTWIPEKFRNNPEKFGEAYTNLEREYHASRQQNKALEENYSNLAAQVEELQSTPRGDPNDAREQLYARFENDPIETIALLSSQAAQQAVAQYAKQAEQNLQPVVAANQNVAAVQAWNGLLAENPDIANYREQIGEFIQENQEYFPVDHLQDPSKIARNLTNVYKIVSRDTAVTQAAEKADQAAQLQAMKLQAQTMSGTTGHPMPPDQAAAEWAAIKAADAKPYWKQ